MNLDNKDIPFIDSKHNIILFDGVCKLCIAWCRVIMKYDRNHIFKFTSMQSEEGQLILKYFNFPTENFTSMYYLENNHIYDKSTAFIRIINLFPYPIKLMSVFRFVPLSFRDFIYNIISRNRYGLFGQYECCVLPTADYPKRHVNKKKKNN